MTDTPSTPASLESRIAAAAGRELAAAEHTAARYLTHIPHPHLARRAAAGPVTTAAQLPAGSALARFNTRVALLVTRVVGSMWCAYLFAAFDLISLPTAIRDGAAPLVAWVAQTFLQLVLLSVIMVGQNVQAGAADARAKATFDDGEAILHYADGHAKSLAELHTKVDSGIATLHDKLDDEMYAMHRRLDQVVSLAAAHPTPVTAPAADLPTPLVMDEHTTAELAKQLGQHLDKITQGAASAPPSADPAPTAPEPPPPPAAAAPPLEPPPAAPPADGSTGSGSTS